MLQLLIIILGVMCLITGVRLKNDEKSLEKLKKAKRKPNETDEAFISRMKKIQIISGILLIFCGILYGII